jgi:DNA polymerase elongation subunit (family B)
MIAKSRKPCILKSVRLLDFHVYDEKPEEPDISDESSGDQNKPIEQGKFIIQMFGIDEYGETYAILIDDFHPFFFIKVGDNWTQGNVNQLSNFIQNKIGKYYQDSIVSATIVDYNKLYGFSAGKKSKFAKFVFKNVAAFNKVKGLWYEYVKGDNGENNRKSRPLQYSGINLQLYESSIPPVLRYFHIHNVSPSGWISVPLNKLKKTGKTTTCNYEFSCRTKDIKPLPEKETRVPYKICSFDIEASSSHGDFPLPKKTYKRLATNIVDEFTKQFQAQPLTREQCSQMCKRMVLTAFGYAKCEGIDLVYPQNKPSKEKVSKLYEIISATSLEKIKSLNLSENDNSELLTIESVFENMKNEIVIENDNDSDDENDYPKPTKTVKIQEQVKKEFCMVDLLMKSEYSRETKIQTINEIFTLQFPRLKGDEVTFIGSTFMRYGEKEPYLNHCLVLGTCDEIDGVVVQTANTERDLLLEWTQLIQQENPDIIIGYNIFGFDYEFMFRRAQELHCENDFLMFSRKIGDFSGKNNNGEISIENTKIQLATGEYDLRYFKMTGRLQIDMYTYFRRDFNLPSYKLDDVAGQFISDDIKKIVLTTSQQDKPITQLYSQNLMGLHVGDFIHIEITGFTSDYYKDGKKFIVRDIQSGMEVVETVKDKEVKNVYNVITIDGHEYITDAAGGKSVKWGMAKDDVTPQDIFRLSRGSSADRAVVAKYCIQDCNLVHHLMNKIDVLTGYVEMSSICSVPISFLVFRGQGIKLTSYVAKKCREKDTLMPDLDKSGSNEGYEGAIVLPPKCSMYMDNPVACVDYASLYPSSMISQNFSHDSKVWSKEYDLDGKLIAERGEKDKTGKYVYDNLPGYEYIDIEFDNFAYRRNPEKPGSRAVKTKIGKLVCRWAQFPNNKKGIMPSILEELLKARATTRKLAKTEKDPFMQNILDKRQLGYKVTANSLYGQCGAKTSTFYEKDVAACTTATGRMMITYAKRIIEEVYGDRVYETAIHGPVRTKAEYVYGDSVAKYTPVYVLRGNQIDICTIESLAFKYGENKWKPCLEEGKEEKEVCEIGGKAGINTWTEKGWTRLFRVIRHKLAPHKKMYRIVTKGHGFVDVTDDHSLINNRGEEIKTDSITLNETALLQNPILPISFPAMTTTFLEELPKFKQCYHLKYRRQAFLEWLGKRTDYLVKGWKTSDGVEHIVLYASSIAQECMAEIVLCARNLFYFDTQYTPKYRQDHSDIPANYDIQVDIEISDRLQYYMNKSMYGNPENEELKTWNTENSKVIFMQELDYKGDYVYDLTTENHHFAAGVGNLIVHNTDSVFFTFNLENPATGEKIRGKPALEMTIEIAQDAADLCTQFLKPPMELTYEKTLMPFILLSKKRYVGMLYENDANKGKLKFMGLSLKRRDSCDYLKDVYGGILNILMKENSVQKAIAFLDKALDELIEGKVSMDKLMITKALRSDYKNPQQIAHRVLADRIGQRDPGNKPKPGDRMKFVHIVSSIKHALQGDKIETPEFILSNKLKIDYEFYITNQLMKPLQQLFGLALENIWLDQKNHNSIKQYKKDIESLSQEIGGDIEVFMKKKEKYCSAKIKTILFDKFLTKIANKKDGLQTITSMFSKRIMN